MTVYRDTNNQILMFPVNNILNEVKTRMRLILCDTNACKRTLCVIIIIIIMLIIGMIIMNSWPCCPLLIL